MFTSFLPRVCALLFCHLPLSYRFLVKVVVIIVVLLLLLLLLLSLRLRVGWRVLASMLLLLPAPLALPEGRLESLRVGSESLGRL